MRAIMVMFDSLNRHMLPAYGCEWTKLPNFRRLAERTATFERSYVGSMPCMPARRELHTGRYNFLHRSWGPLEPFDDSMPELLHQAGVYTHLATDHYHYWEDGGATYHSRYGSFEIGRGQENDFWKGEVREPEKPDLIGQFRRAHMVNRKYMRAEGDWPQSVTFRSGLEFMRTNAAEDNWFLHIETFDPHEPFHAHPDYLALYPHEYDGPEFTWPSYSRVTETPEQVEHCRMNYAALMSMCDARLGEVLDLMDELNLWGDTMLIVNTDHGFMLSEHDFWAKCHMPFYEEVAHTPLFIWDPRCPACAGQRRGALVQTIDLPATLLEYFGVDRPASMQGCPLRDTVATDAPVREGALFGIHGGHVNVTDGRYVYMRAPASRDNKPLFNYTFMPTHMRGFFRAEELAAVELADPFSFTRGLRTMRTPASPWRDYHQYGTLLFDLQTDPRQDRPIRDAAVEARMIDLMTGLMAANDAPLEQYQRLGVAVPAAAR
ncbi:MAG: hypothetical protein BIFFINMI_01564 [Phycisphaerae bacterium]|nr:hypothetical protein [Phycisphaerae bacterium]